MCAYADKVVVIITIVFVYIATTNTSLQTISVYVHSCDHIPWIGMRRGIVFSLSPKKHFPVVFSFYRFGVVSIVSAGHRHYTDVVMSSVASQIASILDVDQRQHQNSASLAFVVRRIHRSPVNSPHKRPVTRKMFPFDDVIMNISSIFWIEETFWSSSERG